MTIAKILASSAAAVSMLVMVPGAAMAGTNSQAASRLALPGARTVNAPGMTSRVTTAGTCMTRTGYDGKWVQNTAGDWLQCSNNAGGFFSHNGVLYALGAVAAGVGIGLGVSGSP